jgi:ATP-dependent RNA helicase RhlE
LILQGAFVPKNIKKLVIDEMDEMLNLGFRSQLKNIIETLPEKRQNLLFSATLPKEIEDLLDEYFSHPVRVEAAPAGTPVANITQLAYDVPNFNTKVNLLNYLLAKDESIQKALVFTESKKFADKLLQSLDPALQEVAGVIHSNKEQNHRFQTVAKLKDGTYRFIIATDIVARGIDIAQVDHVINFDIPENPENYIHRIGRTGRANEKGIALSFVTPKDYEKVKDIEQLMQQDLDIHPLPATVIVDPTLIKEEMPIVVHKEIQLKIKPKENVGPAFHEKKAKNNRQVQKKQSHKEKMMEKYGKSKTRGAKGKKR